MQLSDIISQIKEAVARRVSHRLKVTEAVQIATLLDPSTKDLMCSVPFDEQKKNCWLAVQNLHMRNLTVSTATGASASVSHSAAAASSSSNGDLPAGQTTEPLSKKMRLIQKC